MKKALLAMVAVIGVGTALTLTTGDVMAASSASDADKAFVGKVSQGGAYEVEAGKVAAMRGTTPFIRNFGIMETHDHTGVGAGLKKAASETGVPIAPTLNAEFSARLAKLKNVPADKFDSFYLDDMKQIHNKDEGLFVQESNEGTGPYKDFCHQTAVLVKAHLGWLNTM